MSKRPSLAETMRQAISEPAATVQVIAHRESKSVRVASEFHAATRVGKKKVTANLAPPTHKLLKTLAVQRETTTEALLSEAIADLLSKYRAA
jgi:hypothetical protein